MFAIVTVHDPNHLTCSIAALPGISLCISSSFGSISCLLMTNPTPAVAWGLSGCTEISIFKFFLKFFSSCSVIDWSRYASCMMSITIFLHALSG